MISALLIDAAVTGPMRHTPGRIALAVLAIALGVALGLSIYLINRSAADEISLAARSLYGLADLSVESGVDGFDENLYPMIARAPGVAAASPVVEIAAKLIGARGTITLIGVDAFRSKMLQPSFAALARPEAGGAAPSPDADADAVYLSARAARELNLTRGDLLSVQAGLQIAQLTVAGVLPPAALNHRAGIVDIALVQWRFDRIGKLSRVDVRLAAGANAASVRERLGELLPAGARITTPGSATDDALRLSRAYRSNLSALALVALFTGGFFVYSTQSLLALRRRREFAILHALGMTRAQQRASMLASSALIGAAGAVIGIGAGVSVATLGLRNLGADLGAGYFGGAAASLNVRPLELAAFTLLGAAVAIIGALRPAFEAAQEPTARALKAGDIHSSQARTHMPMVMLMLALAAAALMAPPLAGLPLAGYAAIALLLIAAVALTPAMVRFVAACAPGLRAVPYQIAIAQLSGAAHYATLSVSAIIVSFSLMSSMAIMVASFRDSLDAWTQKLLPADLYLRVGYVGQSSFLDAATTEALSNLAGVARVERSRFAQAQIPGVQRPVTLIARTLDPRHVENALWIIQTAQTPAPPDVIPIWITEAAADLFEWRAGDLRKLMIAGLNVQTFVQGVWRDYEHQNGAVVMQHNVYVRLSGDRAINTVWLWLAEGAAGQNVQTSIRETLPAGAAYDLHTPRELRRLSLAAFDRTFAVTYLLELVAVLIGLFGIAAGVSAQVLVRRGEFGALRHLGFTRAQIAAMLAIEGALLGAVGVIMGLIAGVLVSLILIYVVNRQSFHWSMDLSAPGGLLAALSIALIASAALIAVFVGRHAMSGDVVGAVKEDW